MAEGGPELWRFLFDLDGTILDTTNLIVESFIYTFAQGLGEVVTREDVINHFGRPLMEQLQTLRPQLPNDELVRLAGIFHHHDQSEHDRLVALVPGADQGLARLAAQGFRLGVVTSKRLDLTLQGLKMFHLEQFFEVIVHMDSTVHHKPHPEPVQHALALLEADPSQAAYVGDSPYDMCSGHDAGVRTLGLVYNTFSSEQLRQAGADCVVESWGQVVEVLMKWASVAEVDATIKKR